MCVDIPFEEKVRYIYNNKSIKYAYGMFIDSNNYILVSYESLIFKNLLELVEPALVQQCEITHPIVNLEFCQV